MTQSLEGDQFTTMEWVDAKNRNVPDIRQFVDVPNNISELIQQLKVECAKQDIPMFVALSMPGTSHVVYNLGNKPENCSVGFLLARAVVVEQQEYQQSLVMNPAVLAQTARNKR